MLSRYEHRLPTDLTVYIQDDSTTWFCVQHVVSQAVKSHYVLSKRIDNDDDDEIVYFSVR